MAEQFKPGDRIKIQTGECGRIIRIDGKFAHIELDSSLRRLVATAALQRIQEGDSGKSDKDSENPQ